MKASRLPFAPCPDLAALALAHDEAARALARSRQAARGQDTPEAREAVARAGLALAHLDAGELAVAGLTPGAIASLPDRVGALEQLLAGELAALDAEEPAR